MPSFVKIYPPVLEKIFVGFLPYMGTFGGHLGHAIGIIYINIGSDFLQMFHIKFGFDWPSGSRGEDVWLLWQISPWGVFVLSESSIFSPTALFLHNFSFKRHFYSFPHSKA